MIARRLGFASVLVSSLCACAGGSRKPPRAGTPGSSATPGPVTPDPAPTAGPPPAAVIDQLATGAPSDRICFAWSARGNVMCAVSSESIQGGATMTARVLGPDADDFAYYASPADQQFFEVDPAAIDRAVLAAAQVRATEGGFQGWAGPDSELMPGGTIVVGNHTVRRIRTTTGQDGEPETGVWTTYQDTIELRCDERWVPVPLDGDVFGHAIEAPNTYVVALGASFLLTADVSWGMEGDHGGGRDAALVDAAAICK